MIKKLFIAIIIFFSLFFYFPQSIKAADNNKSVEITINKETLKKGYTVASSDKKLKIGLLPNAFKQAVKVKIKNINNNADPLPENLKLISNIYYFELSASPQKALNLSFKYNSYSAQEKKIYYWDEKNQNWSSWPSKDGGNNTLQTSVKLRTAKIAVFEKKISDENELADSLTAKSAIVMDADTGQVLFAKDSHTQRPIASLTKIMTAIVFLEHNPGWETPVIYSHEDETMPSKIYLKEGDVVKISDLFSAMLVKSANNAAKALVRGTVVDPSYFIQLMNDKALALGLTDTRFTDPTGLDSGDVSTAYDYAHLVRVAIAKPEIPKTSITGGYSFQTVNNQKQINIENGTKILNSDLDIIATKTGYTYEAGNCLMTVAQNKVTGQKLIAVGLGSAGGHISADVYSMLDFYLNK